MHSPLCPESRICQVPLYRCRFAPIDSKCCGSKATRSQTRVSAMQRARRWISAATGGAIWEPKRMPRILSAGRKILRHSRLGRIIAPEGNTDWLRGGSGHVSPRLHYSPRPDAGGACPAGAPEPRGRRLQLDPLSVKCVIPRLARSGPLRITARRCTSLAPGLPNPRMGHELRPSRLRPTASSVNANKSGVSHGPARLASLVRDAARCPLV